MNNDNFNNGNPMNSGMTGMQPQNNMNPGMTGMQPQNNMNPGMTGMQPQNNMDPGMTGMQPQNNMNPGMTGMQPQNNMDPGMTGMQPQNNMNSGMAPQYVNNYGMGTPSQRQPMNKNLIIGIVAGIAGLLVLIIILFATGIIGGKTLTCSMEDTSMGMTMKEEIKIHFKDNKANKVVGKATITYGSNSEYKEYIKSSFESQVEELKEEGIDAKLTTNNDSMTLTITANKDGMEDAFGLYEDDENTYEELKKQYEDEGYTCK